MGIHQIDRIASYLRFLQENPQELDLLFKEFLIGVTGFFRDPLVWKTLCEETLPALLAGRPEGPLRAWVAACSTGEEAYSLAMVFKEVVEKLLPLFHYSLTPSGILLLGNAETVGHFTDLFATACGKARIFRRGESAVAPDPIEFPSSFAPALSGEKDNGPVRKPNLNFQTQAEHLVLRRYAPPTVLVNEQGNVLFISSPTGKYLEPAVGKANLNIFAMARDGLRYELGAAFQKALRQDGPVTLHGLKIETDGGARFSDVTVERLGDAEPLAGLVTIVFRDIATPVETKTPPGKSKRPAAGPRLGEFERELLQARAELVSMREEKQTSQQELTSANEEMQSTNEEIRIDGVVITFWDITVAKTLEAKLQAMQVALEKRLVGQSTQLDKARVDLKEERKRTRKVDGKPPRSTHT